MPTSLGWPPEDIIYHLIGFLPWIDIKNLRGVSRDFRRVVEPQIFATIVFNACSMPLRSQLNDIVAGGFEGIGVHTQTLVIRSLLRGTRSQTGSINSESTEEEVDDEHVETEEPLEILLSKAIGFLVNLTVVEWAVQEIQPLPMTEKIVAALSTLPSLIRIGLDILRYGLIGSSIPVNQFRRLQSVAVNIWSMERDAKLDSFFDELSEAVKNNTELTSLAVRVYHRDGTKYPLKELLGKISPGTDHVLPLKELVLEGWIIPCAEEWFRHLKKLQSLRLPGCSVEPGFWSFLQNEKVHLRSLRFDDGIVMDRAALYYLESYTGLVDLEFNLHHNPSDISNIENENRQASFIARTFFNDVLPRHVQSLESLTILPEVSCGWCFQEENGDAFRQCTNLISLSVNLRDVHRGEIQAGVDSHIVDSLLSLGLPRLQHITIEHSEKPNRPISKKQYKTDGFRTYRRIQDAVKGCQLVNESMKALTVSVAGEEYTVQGGEGGTGLSFRKKKKTSG